MGQAIEADHSQIFLLPHSIEEWIPADHPARFIREFVSLLDFREIGLKVKARGEAGTDHYGERLLLSVWLYGYFTRVRSSRKLEKALKSELPLIWLAGMHQPDHTSLWRFWSSNTAALRKVFKETVLVADQMGMIGFALMAVDGTKVEASGSRRAMWSERSLAAKEADLDRVIAELEGEISEGHADADGGIPAGLADKKRLREEIRVKRALLAGLQRKHLHPGEPDARVMKNQRTQDLCYNVQAVADSKCQVVAAADVTVEENDMHQLVPMLDQVAATLGKVAGETLADSGYATEEQLGKAERREYPVLTAVRKAKEEDRFNASRFHYDPVTDTVACPETGTVLRYERDKDRRGTGLIVRVFRCRDKECPLRGLCSREKRGKSVEVSPDRVARQNQDAKRDLPESRDRIRQRAGIIEPVFALAKVHGGFKRFTYRGLNGARTQWAVEMASHNLRKMFNQWREKGFAKVA